MSLLSVYAFLFLSYPHKMADSLPLIIIEIDI